MSEIELFLLPDQEVRQLLTENDIDVKELLKSIAAEYAVELRTDPETDKDDDQSRDLVMVLLGTSALIAVATPLLKRGIELIARRPILVSEMVLAPVEDSKGKIVKHSDGQPVLHWVEQHKLLEPKQPSPESYKARIDGPLGLHIRLENQRS